MLDAHFWLALGFVVFIYLVYRPIRNAILNTLEKQISNVKSQVTTANNTKMDAQELLNKAQKRITELESIKEQMLNDASINAEQLISKQTQQIELMLNIKKSDALNLIENKKLQVCNQMKQEFTNTLVDLLTEYFKSTHKDQSIPEDSKIAQNLIEK